MCVGGDGFEEGLKEDDPLEDDVFEVELAAVDDVSFALRSAVGFEALEFESIPGATRLRLREEREVIVPGYRDTTDGTIKMSSWILCGRHRRDAPGTE